MSIDAINWAFEVQGLTSTEKLILLTYSNHANEKNEAWPAWSRLIYLTSLDRKTIHYNLKSLQQKGYLMKTGDKVKQVPVYKLCGVLKKEELDKLKAINKNNYKKTTSTKNTTSSENGTGKKYKKLSTTSSENGTSTKTTTSSENGTTTSSENGTTTSSENGTQNHQLNHQRNHQGDLIPFNTQKAIKDQLQKKGLEVLEDTVLQIEYYALQSTDKQPIEQSIKVAVSLLVKKKWKIPSGYKGITSKSIGEADKKAEAEKKEQAQEEGQAYRNLMASPKMAEAFAAMKKQLNS